MDIIQLILRALEFFWTLLIMAIIGNVIHDAFNGNPSIINYDMFLAIFAMLSLFYLIAVAYNENWSIHPLLPLVLDLLNTLFFFAGAVGMAAKLHVHSCGNHGYTSTNSLTNGSYNMKKRCQEEQAVTAFLWFGFACFAASTVLSGLGSRGGVNMRSSGIRKVGLGRV